MKKQTQIFLYLSALLLTMHCLFVVTNYFSARQAAQQAVHDQGVQLRSQFELALEMAGSSMQQMATFVAQDETVQQLFLRGKEAVEAEGGGPGGMLAAVARQNLYDVIGERWLEVQKDYDARQLHFHLGPGSVSFLRVHKLSKFGDRMDDVRHTIVDANKFLLPTKGFETGRVYSGIRGVVPMFAAHPETDAQIHVGALEAGTSFALLLEKMEQLTGVHFGVMLTREHMVENMWPDFIRNHLEKNPPIGNFVLEESRYSEEIRHFTGNSLGLDLLQTAGTEVLPMNGQMYGVTSFPLRDYRGTVVPEREPVGMVLAWQDVTAIVDSYKRTTWNQVILAVCSFLLFELVLYYSMIYVTGRLEKTIQEQVGVIKEMAIRDQLTGLYNRHILADMFAQVQSQSNRSSVPFSMVMLDLDFFKKINDTHGHVKGDEVLAWLGQFITEQTRQNDIAFRFGGEEFMLLLAETRKREALHVCERIRRELARSSVAQLPVGCVTISVGLTACRLDEKDTFDSMSKRADAALYAAKDLGRNRVEVMG
ncbi:MAG: diguanylate cyclase [Desulfobulbaceae bacterium]|uniref:diguanylate cyclase n=1 Tax=Candidatus Desulfatifera sulfidica TaxID=2841691 RepID=A0A8J6NA93_9BACT|nr:diguanylate cyclase [Candidatus Desulfatifera sulfidica]